VKIGKLGYLSILGNTYTRIACEGKKTFPKMRFFLRTSAATNRSDVRLNNVGMKSHGANARRFPLSLEQVIAGVFPQLSIKQTITITGWTPFETLLVTLTATRKISVLAAGQPKNGREHLPFPKNLRPGLLALGLLAP
jgi:hypothetical protein